MAHRESNEREGEAGDALWPANQATTAVGAEEEDGVGDGAPGRPASCGSVVGTGTSRRSSGARRRGEGKAVAAVVLVGGDGCVRVRAREKEQRSGASRKSERGPRGWRGVSGRRGGRQPGRRWPGGKQEVAEASRARATPLFVLLAEEEEDKGEEVGWAGQMGWPAGPVLVGCTVRPGKLGFSLSLSLFYLLFSIFVLFSFI